MIRIFNKKSLQDYFTNREKVNSFLHILHVVYVFLELEHVDINIHFSEKLSGEPICKWCAGSAMRGDGKGKYIIRIYQGAIALSSDEGLFFEELLTTALHELKHVADEEYMGRVPESTAKCFEPLYSTFKKLYDWHVDDNKSLKQDDFKKAKVRNGSLKR